LHRAIPEPSAGRSYAFSRADFFRARRSYVQNALNTLIIIFERIAIMNTENVIASPARISSGVVTNINKGLKAGWAITASLTIAYLSGMSHKKVNDLIDKTVGNDQSSIRKYKSHASRASDRLQGAIDLNQTYDVIFDQVTEKLNQFARDRMIAEGRGVGDKPGTLTDLDHFLSRTDLPETPKAKAARLALEAETAVALTEAENDSAPCETMTVTVALDLDDILAFIATSEGDELNMMIEAITARMAALATGQAIAA
jgi:hypothetical protein